MSILSIICFITRRHKWQSMTMEHGGDLECLRCDEKRRPFA